MYMYVYGYVHVHLKVTHAHLDLRKTIITLVWNYQQSFHLHLIIRPILFLCMSIYNPLFHYSVRL